MSEISWVEYSLSFYHCIIYIYKIANNIIIKLINTVSYKLQKYKLKNSKNPLNMHSHIHTHTAYPPSSNKSNAHHCQIDCTNHDEVINNLELKSKDLYYFWVPIHYYRCNRETINGYTTGIIAVRNSNSQQVSQWNLLFLIESMRKKYLS